MKLHELEISQYRNVLIGKWEMPKNLITYLRDNGYKRLGSGAFSSVYGKPGNDLLIKIGLRDATEDGYPAFADLARQHPNKHFPKVGKIRWMENRHGVKFYVVPVERLLPVNPHDIHNIRLILNFVKSWAKHQNLTTVQQLKEFLAGGTITSPTAVATEEMIDKDPSLLEAFMLIIKHLPERYIDLNDNNIMKRRDGTIVFSDPVA